MLSKEQKIKVIVDVKKGNVTAEVIKVLDNPLILVSENQGIINGIVYEPQVFKSILDYIVRDLKINCLYLMWENCQEDMVNFKEKLMK